MKTDRGLIRKKTNKGYSELLQNAEKHIDILSRLIEMVSFRLSCRMDAVVMLRNIYAAMLHLKRNLLQSVIV